MKRSNYISPVLAAGILGIAGQSVFAQTVLFNDTFNNGSTTQVTATAPTSTSTTYEWFQQGGNPTTPTIAAGDLHLQGRTTASALAPLEAVFTSTPVTLNVGDALTLTIVFANTQNIFPSASDSTINVGLYNSGGVLPNVGARLDTATYNAGGGSQGWNGYVARIRGSGGVSSIFTRAPQGANPTTPTATSQNQDILFNGASGTSAYNNPTGTLIANSGGNFGGFAASGGTYTLSYTIAMTAPGTLQINNVLYDSGNNVLISQTGTTSSSPVTTYDSFGFGWRYNSASAANSADVSSITVTISPIPEPSVAALTLSGLGLLFAVRRFRR
jgi:hypothetical protein